MHDEDEELARTATSMEEDLQSGESTVPLWKQQVLCISIMCRSAAGNLQAGIAFPHSGCKAWLTWRRALMQRHPLRTRMRCMWAQVTCKARSKSMCGTFCLEISCDGFR